MAKLRKFMEALRRIKRDFQNPPHLRIRRNMELRRQQIALSR